jgi:hypothetical protein
MNRRIGAETTSNRGEGMEMEPLRGAPMDNRYRIEKEVEEAIRLMETEASPTDSSDFLAGVRKKIRNLAPEPKLPAWAIFGRRILVPALLILMVVLNIVTAVFVLRIKKSDSLAKQNGLTALAKDYGPYQSDSFSYLK